MAPEGALLRIVICLGFLGLVKGKTDLNANHAADMEDSSGNLVDKLIDKVRNPTFKTLPGQEKYLDDTTLAKPGHLSQLSPRAPPSFPFHTGTLRGNSPLPGRAHEPQSWVDRNRVQKLRRAQQVVRSSVQESVVEPVPASMVEPVPDSMDSRATSASVITKKEKMKVPGRTAVVTGSSQGSGKATALALAKRGWNVVLLARQPERLAKAAAEVESVSSAGRQGSVLAVPCDIGENAAVDALGAAVLEHFQNVDLLVNNAGVCQTASIEGTSVEDCERLMQTNFMGAMRVTKALLPALKASKGTIVNVNSFGGVMPLRGMSAYTASKFALAGWSEALRSELEPTGVHVAQVHPGVINSNWLERAVFEKEDGAQKMRETLKLPGVQTPEEIADAVLEAQEKQKSEVVVGGVFQAFVAAYRLTGVNPFAAQDPNSA